MIKVVDSPNARKADLAAIHIAKSDLGWDDDHYRDVLFAVCRVKSSRDLDFTGRKRFLEHLRSCGWPGRAGQAAGARQGSPARTAMTKAQRLIWSLWQRLYEAGAVDSRAMPALAAYVKRQTGVDRLEWLNYPQETVMIESLKKWLARVEQEGLQR